MECKHRAMFVVGILASLLFALAASDLNVIRTKECGQLTCGYAEFCSPIDNTCKHCRKICDEGYNQDVLRCNEHCQDYIHDARYARKDENSGSYDENKRFKELQMLSTISLIVSLVVGACLVFVILTLCLNKKTSFNIIKLASQIKKNKKKNGQPDITRKHEVGAPEISTIRMPEDKLPKLHETNEVARNDPRSPQMDLSTLTTTFKNYHAKSEPDSVSSIYTNRSNRTSQPLPVRLPSEDSTMDFIYDNPALAPSPTLDNEKEKVNERKVNSNDT